VLYVDAAEVVVESDGHDSYVDGENYAAATPALLADVEAGLLEHMISEHADEVATLTSLIPVDLCRVADRVVPVRLDRFGLILRAIPANGRPGMYDCSSMRLFTVRGSSRNRCATCSAAAR
jgi:hypothetical protein